MNKAQLIKLLESFHNEDSILMYDGETFCQIAGAAKYVTTCEADEGDPDIGAVILYPEE